MGCFGQVINYMLWREQSYFLFNRLRKLKLYNYLPANDI